VSITLSAPLPAEEEAPILPVLPYGALAGVPFQSVLPYGALVGSPAYGVPVLALNPLESGVVYPTAETYVHDNAGDESDNTYPEAEVYVHDTTGDA